MTAADDELLARVLAGDLDPESQVWKAALARDPALAARWAEFSALMRALERTGEDERTALEQARATLTERDFQRVRQAFEARRADRGKRAWWRRPVLAYLAAAVVVAVGAFLLLKRDEARKTGGSTYLGDADYVGLEPTLELGDARRFRWEGTLPSAGDFVVRVFAVDAAGAPGTIVLEHTRCIDNTWRPDPDELAKIPDEFFWEVEARAAGAPSGELSAPQRALRSRP